MLSSFFHLVVYDPLYNSLVFLLSVLPSISNVALAIIALTVAVKIILFPLARKAIHTQRAMRVAAPKLEEIKKQYKDDQKMYLEKTLALYREYNIHPFASIATLFIQIPVILGLYWVFYKGGLPTIDTTLLYSFVPPPESVDMHFIFGINMGDRSVALAVLAGVTQFLHALLSVQKPEPPQGTPTFKDDLMRSMHVQVKYVLPVLVGIFAYTISAAVALYWIVSNTFTIGQELLVRKEKHGKDTV